MRRDKHDKYFRTDYKTNYLKQSRSLEANSRTPPEINPRLLWRTKIHYRVYKSRSLHLIVGYINPARQLLSLSLNPCLA